MKNSTNLPNTKNKNIKTDASVSFDISQNQVAEDAGISERQNKMFLSDEKLIGFYDGICRVVGLLFMV